MIESTLVQARVQWIPSSRQKSYFGRFKGRARRHGYNADPQRRKIHEEPQFGQRVDDNFQWSIGSATSKAAVKVQGRTKDGRAG